MVAAEDELNYWRLAAMVLKIEWLPSFFSMHLLAVGTLSNCRVHKNIVHAKNSVLAVAPEIKSNPCTKFYASRTCGMN